MATTGSALLGENPAVLIAGPTASGKSRAALAIARAFGGVVINADAMQCYRELGILTARPSAAEEREVPHRLYGHRSAREPWSAGIFAAEAAAQITAAWQRQALPVITGGTGLYLRVLEHGHAVSAHPGRDPPALARGAAAGRRRCPAFPPGAGGSPGHPPERSAAGVRALEVAEVTGEPFSAHHARHAASGILRGASLLRLAIVPDRARLYERIDRRAADMIAAGGLGEVRQLLALELDPALPAMRAVGVEALAAQLAGAIDQGGALARMQQHSRNLAKRQLTWIRGQMSDFLQVSTAEAAVEAAGRALGASVPALDESLPRG